jgi:SAM-dependent methyltransferase
MTNEQIMCILGEAIKKWAQAKRAFISLSTYAQEIEEWKKLTSVHQVGRMLEIGSGAGWFLVTALALGFAQEGIGIDPAFSEDGTAVKEIHETKSIIEKLNLDRRVRFYICTFDDFLKNALSKTEKFDLLVFRNTLHHIYPYVKRQLDEQEQISKCIRDLRSTISLLNEPGYLYIVEATRPSRLYEVAYNLYRAFRGAPTINWESKRTLSEWIWIVEEAGFNLIGSSRLRVPHLLFSRIPIFAKFLSSQFLISAIYKER